MRRSWLVGSESSVLGSTRMQRSLEGSVLAGAHARAFASSRKRPSTTCGSSPKLEPANGRPGYAGAVDRDL